MKIRRNAQTQHVQARRVLRREVDWVTRYMLEGNRDQAWRECRVLDVSRGGAGVELSDTTLDEARAHRVVLEFEIPPAVLRLRGEVRHAGPGSDGSVHVGLEFASLTALERDMLDSLLERDSSR
jgi:PilZ domain